jgi:hypothetical protein
MSDSAHAFTLGIEEEFQIIAPAKKIHQEIDRVDQSERSVVRQDFLFPLVDDVGEGSCLRDRRTHDARPASGWPKNSDEGPKICRLVSGRSLRK